MEAGFGLLTGEGACRAVLAGIVGRFAPELARACLGAFPGITGDLVVAVPGAWRGAFPGSPGFAAI